MTIYDAIQQGHNLLRELLSELTAARSPERRESLLQELRQALQLHMQIEEQVFYRRLRRFPILSDEIAAAKDAYAGLLQAARQVARDIDDRAAYTRGFGSFRSTLDARLAYEEGPLFSMARQIIPPVIAELMGDEWRDIRTAAIEKDYMSSAVLRTDAGYYA